MIVCIVGVKLPRVLSRRAGAARQHPREFDTNNTYTIMFDPLSITHHGKFMVNRKCCDPHILFRFCSVAQFD